MTTATQTDQHTPEDEDRIKTRDHDKLPAPSMPDPCGAGWTPPACWDASKDER